MAIKAALNTEVAEVESRMPDITTLATKAALNRKATYIENKIPDTTDFITTPEFNTLAKISSDARMQKAAKSLASKSQVDSALDIADKSREKIKKLQTFDLSYFQMFDLSYFNDRRYFDNDGSQNYLLFQPVSKTFRMPADDAETIIAWKSKGLSDKSIKPPTTPVLLQN